MPAAVESMAYVRAVPWHGLGTKVGDLMTADEALIAGGVDWEVRKMPLRTSFLGDDIRVPAQWANVRQSDGAVLGIVGDTYQIVQQSEAFDWADSLVDDGSAKYETVGSLMGGRRVFLSMELPSGVHVPGDEGETKPYLLMTNGHDGVTALQASVTMVRVVCANTWTLALKAATRSFKIRHTGSIEGKLAAARQALGITFEYVAEFQAQADRLVAQTVTDKQANSVFERVFGIPARADKDPDKIDATSYGKVRDLYQSSTNLDPIRGTGWGVLQAVGEFVDHEMSYFGRRFSAEDVRADSILYGGPAAEKKQHAFAILTSRDFGRPR